MVGGRDIEAIIARQDPAGQRLMRRIVEYGDSAFLRGWHEGYAARNIGIDLEGAMFDIADSIAIAHGWEHEETEDGQTFAWPDDDDVVRALRESVPLAVAFMRIFACCRVEPIPLVEQAAADFEPIPSPKDQP